TRRTDRCPTRAARPPSAAPRPCTSGGTTLKIATASVPQRAETEPSRRWRLWGRWRSLKESRRVAEPPSPPTDPLAVQNHPWTFLYEITLYR
ncbi:unnamed protein product, partial [Tetraodon nigroviridis]